LDSAHRLEGVVVVASGQIETASLRHLQSFRAARVGREAVVRKFSVCEVRSAVAGGAVPLADENLQPALGCLGIGPGLRALAAGERATEAVERRRRSLECLLERGEGLGNVDQHLLVVGRGGCLAERAPVAAGKLLILAHRLGDVMRGGAQLSRVEDGTDALRPKAVGAAVPAI